MKLEEDEKAKANTAKIEALLEANKDKIKEYYGVNKEKIKCECCSKEKKHIKKN